MLASYAYLVSKQDTVIQDKDKVNTHNGRGLIFSMNFLGSHSEWKYKSFCGLNGEAVNGCRFLLNVAE